MLIVFDTTLIYIRDRYSCDELVYDQQTKPNLIYLPYPLLFLIFNLRFIEINTRECQVTRYSLLV